LNRKLSKEANLINAAINKGGSPKRKSRIVKNSSIAVNGEDNILPSKITLDPESEHKSSLDLPTAP
jgi:hypothetical protein